MNDSSRGVSTTPRNSRQGKLHWMEYIPFQHFVIAGFFSTISINTVTFRFFDIFSPKLWMLFFLPVIYILNINKANKFSYLHLATSGLLLLFGISLLSNPADKQSYTLFVAMAIALALFLSISALPITEWHLQAALRAIAYAGLILNALGLFFFGLFSGAIIDGDRFLEFIYVHSNSAGDLRLAGFSEPNIWGIHAVLFGIIGIGYFKKNGSGNLALTAAALSFGSVLLSFSRTAYLVTGIIIVLHISLLVYTNGITRSITQLVIFRKRPIAWMTGFLIALLVSTTLMIVLTSERLDSRFSPGQSGDLFRVQRGALWSERIDVILRYPLLGAGLGYDPEPPLQPSAHNSYLEIASEAGIIAGLLFVLLWTGSIYYLLRSLRLYTPLINRYSFANMWPIYSGIVGLISFAFASIQYDIFFWVILGFIISASYSAIDRSHKTDEIKPNSSQF